MTRALDFKPEYTAAHKEELAKYNFTHYIGKDSMTVEEHIRVSKNQAKEYRLGVYENGDAYTLNLVSRNDEEYKPHDSGKLYQELKSKLEVGLCLKCEKANDRKDQDECICSSCKAKAFGK